MNSDELLLQRLQKLTGHPPISSIPYQSQPTKTPTKPVDQDLLNELLNEDTLLTGVIDQSYEETNLSVPEMPLGKRYSGSRFIDYTTLALTSPESASIADWEADLLVREVQEEVALEKKYGTVIEDSESGLSDKTSEGSESSDSSDGSEYDEKSDGSSDIVKSD